MQKNEKRKPKRKGQTRHQIWSSEMRSFLIWAKEELGLRLREGEKPSLLVLEDEGRRKARGVLKKIKVWILV